MTQQTETAASAASDAKSATGGKAVAGPFTIRDVVVLVSVLIIFVASLLPLAVFGELSFNTWSGAGLYFIFIGILLPLIVATLFVIRRVSPDAKLRIGSLSLDQFTSVVASFAFAYFMFATVSSFEIAYLVGAIGAGVLLCATVLATIIPVFAADFAGRAEVPAHTVARDAARPAARPATPKPTLALSAGTAAPTATSNAGAAAGANGAPAAGGAPGWSAARQPNHTAGGQVFTPAGTAPAGATVSFPTSDAAAATSGSANGAASGAAGATQESGSEETAAPSNATAAAHNPATRAEPVINSVPNATTTQAKPEASQASEPVSGVVMPDNHEAPQTRMNPQVSEPIGATVDPHGPAAVSANPFWFAVDRPQNVVDDRSGQFLYKLAPGAWILALEDRGTSFLVQDGNGKTGVLLDLVGIERAPESE